MTDAVIGTAGARRWQPSRWTLAWLTVVAATVAVYLLRDLWPWMVEYPKQWVVPLRFWISDFMDWLVNDFDLGLFTFKEFTRSIAWLLDWPLAAAQGLLSSGFKIETQSGTSIELPRLSWLAVIAVVVGHIYAVYLAHIMALRLYGSGRAALLSQLPLVLLMVAYTMISLWILSQPIVESG